MKNLLYQNFWVVSIGMAPRKVFSYTTLPKDINTKIKLNQLNMHTWISILSQAEFTFGSAEEERSWLQKFCLSSILLQLETSGLL